MTGHYRACSSFDTTEARREFVCALLRLPRTLCAIYPAVAPADTDVGRLRKKREGPAAAEEVLLGVNRTGLHVFRAASGELLHSAPYREIRRVASGKQARTLRTFCTRLRLHRIS